MFRYVRFQSTLTHVGANGQLNMVNVSNKSVAKRLAVAKGRVYLGETAFGQVLDNQNKKGDVLMVAKIAGIQGAKNTHNLIPLCHNLLIHQVKMDLDMNHKDHSIDIAASVTCEGKTGVEMEAIMAVSVAACTVYDMCKAVNKNIRISDIRLSHKSGGKSGEYNE